MTKRYGIIVEDIAYAAPDGRPLLARLFRPYRLRAAQARLLGRSIPPAWCYLRGPQVDLSSTELRESGAWVR